MKIFRRSIIPSVILFSVLAAGAVRGDVVVLKTGERYEGKVVSEDATSLTIEYRPTPNTRDTRTISKADIKDLIRLTPSQAEFEELKLADLLPSKDLLTSADYERIIQDTLRSFANKHKGTPEAEKAEEMIKELSAEKERVSKGELKVDGKWMNADDVRRDHYEIEAYRLRKAMNDFAASKSETRYFDALRTFERLQKEYAASINFVKAVPEAIEIVDSYIKQLNGMIAEQPILAQKREAGLKALSGPDAQATKQAVDQEIAEFKVKTEQDKKDRVKWPSIYKYDQVSLKTALEAAIKERTVLGNLDLKSLSEENEQLTAILRSIADENVDQAKAQLQALPRTTMINKTVLSTIEKQISTLDNELKERAKRDASARVMAQTTQSTGEQTSEVKTEEEKNVLAEALRKAQEEKAKKAEEKKAEEKKRAEEAAKQQNKIQQEQEVSALADYIPLIGGGLLVVLLIAYFLGKRKPKAD